MQNKKSKKDIFDFNEFIEKSLSQNKNYLIINNIKEENVFLIVKKRKAKIVSFVSHNVFNPQEINEDKEYWILMILCKNRSNIKDKVILELLKNNIPLFELINCKDFFIEEVVKY